MHIYLCNRLVRTKPIPYGSVLDPLSFNIVFLSNILLFIANSDLYNYAADNTL